jgi:hypothetical protein
LLNLRFFTRTNAVHDPTLRYSIVAHVSRKRLHFTSPTLSSSNLVWNPVNAIPHFVCNVAAIVLSKFDPTASTTPKHCQLVSQDFLCQSVGEVMMQEALLTAETMN